MRPGRLARLAAGAATWGVVGFTACASPPVGIGPSDSPGVGGPSPSPDPAPQTVIVAFGQAQVTAEVAATPGERAQGLMNRTELGENAGMLFLFPMRGRGGFWMKNTLIPLSIAFMQRAQSGSDQAWTVVAILDMEPCPQDPCPVYRPEADYDAALEVNQGWFARNGVSTGAPAAVIGVLPGPS